MLNILLLLPLRCASGGGGLRGGAAGRGRRSWRADAPARCVTPPWSTTRPHQQHQHQHHNTTTPQHHNNTMLLLRCSLHVASHHTHLTPLRIVSSSPWHHKTHTLVSISISLSVYLSPLGCHTMARLRRYLQRVNYSIIHICKHTHDES